MLNDVIQTERSTVGTVVGGLKEKKYFVDDTFQRRLIWTETQKIKLVETILMGYPVPEFYVWQQPSDLSTGEHTYSIVDGQQRLNSLSEFVSNEWPLKKSVLDRSNKDQTYAGKFWIDITDQFKGAIWDYWLNIRQIPNDISKREIEHIFVRINETDRSLNPQEIRHAKFNGEFIQLAERVADLDTLKSWDVFTAANIRRMIDIEFASSLLIYQRVGVTDDTTESINRMYDLYNDKYEKKNSDFNRIKTVFKRIDHLFNSNHQIKKFFNSVVNLYSLYVTLDTIEDETMNDRIVCKRLVRFIKEYQDENVENPLTIAYRKGASSRTRSKSSRVRRVDSLVDFLKA